MVVAPADAAQRVERTGAGLLLRTAREAQGLHIAMLAVSLKVPVKKLEALEADRYDLLPDMVFVRALAASVCRLLKMDAAPVLAALPQSEQPHIKANESGLNTVIDDAPGGMLRIWTASLRKPFGITVTAVIMGILLIAFLPDEWLGSTFFVLGSEEKLQVNAQSSAKLEGKNVAANSNATGLVQAVQETDRSTNSTPSVVADAPAPLASSPEVLPTAITSASVAPMAVDLSGHNLITLRALGTSWVEVVDAKGITQVRKTLVKDEMISVTGALPLSVVLGRADLVSVTVRGSPFDTVDLAKDHVARFEVK